MLKLDKLFSSVGMASEFQDFDPAPALALFPFSFFVAVILMEPRSVAALGSMTMAKDLSRAYDSSEHEWYYNYMDIGVREDFGIPVLPRMECDKDGCPTRPFIVAFALYLMQLPPLPKTFVGLRSWQIFLCIKHRPDCYPFAINLDTNLVRYFCGLPPIA